MQKTHFLKGYKLCVSRAKSQAQPRKYKSQNEDVRKLFIGGVPTLTTLKEFSNYFSQFGELVDVMLPQKSDGSTLNLGFGFVTFKENYSALMVLDSDQLHSFRGKFVC